METRRSAVIELFKTGKCRSEIASLLGYNRMFISRTLSRFADTGDVLDRPRPGVHVLLGQFLWPRGCNNGLNEIPPEVSEKWPLKQRQTGNWCGGLFVTIWDESVQNEEKTTPHSQKQK